jgi:TonB-dependent receptor
MQTPLVRVTRIRNLLAFACGAALAAAAAAQTPGNGAIQGRVLNASNNKYLESAVVSIKGTSLQATTNLYGEYRIFDVPPGSVTVTVTFGGLEGATRMVTVSPGQTADLDFSLGKPGAAESASGEPTVKLDAFVVAAEKDFNANDIAINTQRYAPNMEYVMSSDAFGSISQGNLGEFLKFLPSVTVEYNSMDARWIMVQGVSARYTSVTVDGMRMASAASTSPGRFFELEQDSIHNIARAEISISRTPELPADALGGSINMVSLSAFEYAHPEIDYDVFLSTNSAWEKFQKTPGPGDGVSTEKIMPGLKLTVIEPVSKTFGFTLGISDSNLYNPQYRSNPQWYANGTNSSQSATSPYLTAPYLEKYILQDAPKISVREAYSANADWKISPNDTLSFAVQENAYNSYVHARGISFDTGTGAMVAASQPATVVAGDYGPTYTDGLAGKGSVTMYSSDRKKFGRTFNANARYTHNGPVWTVNGALSFSHASAHYADVANGYPDVISLTMKSVTVDYSGMDQYGYVRPAIINVFTNASPAVQLNPFNYAGYNIASMTSDPADASDVYRTYKGSVKRDLEILGTRTTVTLGAQIQTEDRDIHTHKNTFTFTPTGSAALAGNYNLGDPVYSTQPPPWGFPAVQWASNNAFYQYFLANPQNFQLTQTGTGGAIAYEVSQSPFFTETIDAAYAMGDTKLMDNRLELVYGVRGEQTKDDIQGGLFDPGAGLTLPTGSIAQTLAQYTFRGAHVSEKYSGVYPSVNLSFNITKDLVFRAAYNRSVGRPDLNNIIPGYSTVSTTAQTINAPNPALAPEQANNFVANLQYYPTHGGVIQGGVFLKDFTNFWGSVTTSATSALLNQLGLPQDYLGYQVTTPFNSGTAQVRGIDINMRQNMSFLSGWAKGFTVFANATSLHLQGARNADFNNFIAREVNWGVSYGHPRFSLSVNWNYRGNEREGSLGFDPSTAGYQYYEPRLQTDCQATVNLTRHVSVYFSGSNITNQVWDQANYSPLTPGYAKLLRREDFGATWQLGIKGSF